MSLINTFEASLLKLIFQNIGLADVGDATGLVPSTGAGNIYVSLHTVDPGDAAAAQDDDEATYTGYARQTAVRSASGWTVAGTAPTVCDNAAEINMGENTGSSQTVTDFGLGFAVSGTTTMYMKGTADLVVGVAVNPQFAIGALDVSLD